LVGPNQVKALCVATRCTSAEQFISMFHRFSDETSFFVATMNQRPVGLETPFSIQLADRSPVLRGTCVVLDAWTTPENPYRRPGVRLGIRRLTPESEPVFKQLQVARANLGESTAETSTEPLSETPVAIPLPPSASRPPTLSRTATGQMRPANRAERKIPRAGSVMAPAQIPPKTPPEAAVLEIILPIVADSPSEAIALPVEVEPRVETRTPGSEYILPANPLMNLTDESLEGFVDCTLYEDTANFPIDLDPPQVMPTIPLLAGDEHVLIAPARSGTTIPPPMSRRTGNTIPPVLRLEQNVLREEPSVSAMMPLPASALRVRTGNTLPPAIHVDQAGMLRVDTPTGPSEPLRLETQSGHSGMLRLESTGMLRVETASGHSGLLRVDGASGMLHVEQLAPPPPPMPMLHSQPLPSPKFFADEMVRTPVPAGQAFVTPRAHRPTSKLSGWTSRRTLIAGGAAAASLVVILILATRSSADDTKRSADLSTPPPPPRVQAPPPTATPAPEPAVATTPTKPVKPAPIADPGESDPPDRPDGATVVGEGPCKLDIKTTPAGTMVAIDGRTVGPSPIAFAGSCERKKVDLMHPRYKAEQRIVALTDDKPTNLDVTLIRPTHSLKIVTSPPGAEVYIAGRRAGTSPTAVQINGFSGVAVRIERVGFGTVNTRVYSKTAEDKLFISLNPNRRPK
jgi:hypothetical protein